MSVCGSRKWWVCTLCLALAAVSATWAQDPPRGQDGGTALHFPGPAFGNRVASFAGIPGNTMTYYAGASSGGIWKSSDDKIYASAWMVYYSPPQLNGAIGGGAGEVTGGDGFGPTDVQPKLLAMLGSDQDKGAAPYQAPTARIPAFNEVLRKGGAIPWGTLLEPLPDLRRAYPRE